MKRSLAQRSRRRALRSSAVYGLALALATLAACSGPAEQAPSDDVILWDVVTYDTTADTGESDTRTSADALFGDDAIPGTFGAPCDTHLECTPGLCAAIEGFGRRCVRSCLGSGACPADWRCVGEDAPDVGLVFICLPEVGGCVEVSECGDCDPHCHLSAVGAGTTAPFALDGATTDGIALGADGSLAIAPDALTVTASKVWVPNTDERTVSRVAVATGAEIGRYVVCDEPVAAAVGLHGDAYIACRGDGRVARVLADVRACPDTNGNQRVDTAVDANADYQITGPELLAEGDDECVLWRATPLGAASAVAVAIDRADRPWVALALDDGGGAIARLDPHTGAVLESFATPGGLGGLAFGPDGALWSASQDAFALVRLTVHLPALDAPEVNGTGGSHELTQVPIPGPCTAADTLHDVAVDQAGAVWVAAGACGLVRYRPEDGELTQRALSTDTRGPVRRIAVGRPGRLAVAQHDGACDSGDSVAIFDTAGLAVASRIAVDGIGPSGVAFDAAGDLWVAASCRSNVRHYTVEPNGLVLARATGHGPAFVGDASGHALRSVVAPAGYYRATVVGWPDGGTRWIGLELDAELAPGAALVVRHRAADTLSGLARQPWSPLALGLTLDDFPFALDDPALAGRGYLEVELGVQVPLGASDGSLLRRLTVRYSRQP